MIYGLRATCQPPIGACCSWHFSPLSPPGGISSGSQEVCRRLRQRFRLSPHWRCPLPMGPGPAHWERVALHGHETAAIQLWGTGHCCARELKADAECRDGVFAPRLWAAGRQETWLTRGTPATRPPRLLSKTCQGRTSVMGWGEIPRICFSLALVFTQIWDQASPPPSPLLTPAP